jgi:hypothetical protein
MPELPTPPNGASWLMTGQPRSLTETPPDWVALADDEQAVVDILDWAARHRAGGSSAGPAGLAGPADRIASDLLPGVSARVEAYRSCPASAVRRIRGCQ